MMNSPKPDPSPAVPTSAGWRTFLVTVLVVFPVALSVIAIMVYYRDPLNTQIFRTVVLPTALLTALTFGVVHQLMAWRTAHTLRLNQLIAGSLASGVFTLLAFYALSLGYIVIAPLTGTPLATMQTISDLRLFIMTSITWLIALNLGWVRATTLR